MALRIVSTFLLTWVFTVVTGDQQILNDQLYSRLEVLEKQGDALLTYIQKLEGQIEEQNECIRSQDKEIAELKGQIGKQNLIIEELQHQHSNSHNNLHSNSHHNLHSNSHHANGVSGKNKLLNTLVQAKSRQSRLLLDPSENIVFYAKISKTSLDHIGVNQTVVFESAPTNLGGGYSTQTGIFTVPRQGIYLMSTSFVSYLQHHHEIHLAVMHNTQELGRVVAHGDSGHLDQGSTVLVSPLNAGDKIYLKNIGDPDNSLGGDGYSNFMAVLLYEI